MEKMIYDNKELCSYVIENEYLKVEVSNLGATLLSFVDKKTGRDIVLGYNSFEEYLKNSILPIRLYLAPSKFLYQII